MRHIILVFILFFTAGCATLSSLPQDASDVDFTPRQEGKTGWSEYQEIAFFPNISPEVAYQAAKAGLGEAGFSLRQADFDKRTVMGAHGMTAHDWNIVAGVYYKPENGGCWVKVVVEGSKDIGFSGDATSGAWTQKILKGMRDYIKATTPNNESQSMIHIP